MSARGWRLVAGLGWAVAVVVAVDVSTWQAAAIGFVVAMAFAFFDGVIGAVMEEEL